MIYLFSYKSSYYCDCFYNTEDEGTYCIVVNNTRDILCYWTIDYGALVDVVLPFEYEKYERVLHYILPTPEMFELRKEQIVFDKL